MKLIFTRKELKYIIDQPTFSALQTIIRQHTTADRYNQNGKPYPIYSIYYDTKYGDLAQGGYNKDLYYRYKIRLRSYHDFQNTTEKVFLELKKKVNGTSNKRRICLPYQAAVDFVEHGKPPTPDQNTNAQIVRELTHYINKHPLHPTTHVTYNRYAYTGDKDLRITFDSDITTTSYADRSPQKLLDPDQYILEIKATGSIPLWLAHLLSAHKLYQRSFSKYGKSYENQIKKGLSNV